MTSQKRKVIIFGMGDYAEQALYYLTHDSDYQVTAFTVTQDHLKDSSVFGYPLLPFEEIETLLPPDEYLFFAPMSGRKMNLFREEIYNTAKGKGYAFISYVSSKALTCQNSIGENCFILEGCNLQPFVTIGNNVIVWCQTHIGHHSKIEDAVFISSGVNICGRTTIGKHCYLSSDAIIDANVTLAEGTLVSLNTIIKRDTDPWGIYDGNPTKKRKVSSNQFAFL